MRASVVSIAALVAVQLILLPECLALDTSAEEKQCADIGFTRKTEPFANCVLELLQRSQRNGMSTPVSSPDDQTCRRFGFQPQTPNHSECLLRLEVVKRQAIQRETEYAEQRRAYEQQLAAYEKERERQRSLKQMEIGLRMLSGQSATDATISAAGLAPIAPKAPGPLVQTIVLPGGRQVTCTTVGTVTNCL